MATMKPPPTLFPRFRIALAALVIALSGCAAPPRPTPRAAVTERPAAGIPLPERYAALLQRAEAGTLKITPGERPEPREKAGIAMRMAAARETATPDVFTGSYRKTAKISFTSA